MSEVNPRLSLLATAFLSFIIFSSCNYQAADIPFPMGDSGYPQPVSQPLKFSEEKKINWLTVFNGEIKPSIRKLDLYTLTSTPYNPSGFDEILKPPVETHFDFNSLPDAAFNLDNIPSKPMQFRTSVLPPPKIIKTSLFLPKDGARLSVSDMGPSFGLQGNNMFCLMQDRSGFIWIGTDKGIYRYDGEYLQSYGLRANNLIEDKEGRIWYINVNGFGMIDIHKRLSSFSNFTYTPFPNLPRMIFDDKGRIWVSRTIGKGVEVVDPVTMSVKHIDHRNGLSGTDVWSVHMDEKKNIWIATNGGADIINPHANKISHFKKAEGLYSDTLSIIIGDGKGGIWMAFRNGGLMNINAEKGTIIRYSELEGFNNELTYRMIYDHNDRLWMATSRGLVIVDPLKGQVKLPSEAEGIPRDYTLDVLRDQRQRVWVATFQRGLSLIEQNAQVVYPLGRTNLSTLFEDRDGNIWGGTTSSGIEILNPKKKLAIHLTKQMGFQDNLIQSFSEAYGNICVTSNGGLDIIDQSRKRIEHYGRKEGLLSDTIYSSFIDTKGNLWLTGPSRGVGLIDSSKTRIRMINTDNGLSGNNISALKQDKQGWIWIATQQGGISIIDPETGTIRYLNNVAGLMDTCNKVLLMDSYGRMWIGTDKGIYVADRKAGTLTSITTREGLTNDYISSLLGYKDLVIAGTHDKASIITPPVPSYVSGNGTNSSKWSVSFLAKSEGLSLNTSIWDANYITRDGKYLWGDAGITVIHPIEAATDSANTFITGMNIMNQPQHFMNPVSIGEMDTLRTPDSFYLKGQTPVNTGYIMQGSLGWDSLSGPYNTPVNLQLPYDKNYIQFQFAQANLGRQDLTLYSYILMGIDKHWSNFENKTFTDNYLNLPPGEYTFKVRSRNLSGLWGPPAVISFSILPPWWKTWWAYALFILALAGLVWSFVQYRSKQLLRENSLLEEKVAHRTSQLKQSLEDLKATQSQLVQSEKMASLGELTAGIAHEIQNPLNFVNNFSEVNAELSEELKDELKKTHLSPAERESIESIADNIRQNQEKINFHGKRADAIVKGMLQHSRSSNGLKELSDINLLADEYLRLAYHGLRAKDSSFNASMKTNFDQNLEKIRFVPQDIGRVILNLITNAFYAATEKKKKLGAGFEPTVTVSTRKKNDMVEISVKDNGNGIPQKVLDKIFQPFFTTKPAGQGTGLGLSLSYDIIKTHNGELIVNTREGEYAEFIISLPA